ncbi:MAG: hybrid sensor histidine kinase/response regulator [Chloroflexia bacterium]
MPEIDLTAFYGQFRDEAWENLDLLEQGLTALEANPQDSAWLDRMLRAIHTTKGSAKILGFGEINRLAHQIEEVLGAIRKGTLTLTPEVGNALLEASAGIRALTSNLVEGKAHEVDWTALVRRLEGLLGKEAPAAESAAPVTVAAHAGTRPRETIRVDLERVDRLSRMVGEMLALQQEMEAEPVGLLDLQGRIEEAAAATAGLRDRLEAYRERLRPLQAEEVFSHLERLEEALRRLEEQIQTFSREHSGLVERFSLSLAGLHQETLGMRMVPIATLFEVFPGVVRRLAAECGVEVALEIRGSEVELDRRVLDHLRDPVVHLVRNALDHGIEPPAERRALGKPERGRILLEATAQGQRVHVRIADDGRGIDFEAVRRKAVQEGWMSAEAAQEASEGALLDLLFRPGFSTRDRVSDLSGRGVGLDIVRTVLHALSGLVHIHTRPGQGTSIVLDVPLTVATLRVLTVECGGNAVALPTSAVKGLLRTRPDEMVLVEGRPTIPWQGEAVPLFALADLLGWDGKGPGQRLRPTLIVGSDHQKVGLAVDRLVDEAEVVVRPLGDILEKSRFLSAATISGAGRVIPILDVAALLRAVPVRRADGAQAPDTPLPRRAPARVLLVEDAIVTRELERSILEAAGYQVVTAFDGVDALEKLEQDEFHLLITDIEMPRMDGFELTARIRQEPRWSSLPVVIVSARGDEESRRRGLQVGAQAYIAKSRFDQNNLLETVAQLLG